MISQSKNNPLVRLACLVAIGAMVLCGMPAMAQPGHGQGRGQGGNPGGGPGWNPGGGPGYRPGPLPPGNRRVVVRGNPYWFFGGFYYRPHGPGYVRVPPPMGIVVPVLPAMFTTLVVAGMTYYLCQGVYYQSAPGGYVVVQAPTTVQTVPAAPTGVVGPSQSASGMATVMAPSLNVRTGPGMAYPVTQVIGQGQTLTIQGRTGNWIFVTTPNGTVGWVAEEFTNTYAPTPSG